MSMPISRVFHVLQIWLAENYPTELGEEVILKLRTGKRIAMPIPEPPRTSPPACKYSKKMLRTIYDVIPDGEPITFQAIVNRTEYSKGSKSAIYACLRRLRELGKVEEIANKYRKCPKQS